MNKKTDEMLHVDTMGIVQYYADAHHNRYEPTDYRVLERIKEYVNKDMVLLDYGCGKGRVDFYFRKVCSATCIGIEYNREIYLEAIKNLHSSKLDRITFVCEDATKYEVDSMVNCFYFFNPFSIQILKKVMHQILDSYYTNPREMTFIFYYPSQEYISYLFSIDLLKLVVEIDVNDIFSTNNLQEKIFIYKMF